MLRPIVVLADEAVAAAFVLAGIDARSVSPAQLPQAFGAALASAALVVLTRRLAEALPVADLHDALIGPTPLVLVMPEITDPDAASGFGARMRRVLGIET